MEGDFYIVSLKHTQRQHPYITVWRDKDSGYAFPLSWAGKYPVARVMSHLNYYNNGSCSVAVPCEILDAAAVPPEPGMIDNDAGPVVGNTPANWKLILANLIKTPAEAPHPQFKGAPRRKETPRPRRILIIGGNMRQAENAAREAQLSHGQCTYVGLAEGLRGKLPSPYWLVGTWQMRRDLPEIFQELRRGEHYAWLPGEPIVERG